MMAGRATKGGVPSAYVLRGSLPVVAAADAFSEVNKAPLGYVAPAVATQGSWAEERASEASRTLVDGPARMEEPMLRRFAARWLLLVALLLGLLPALAAPHRPGGAPRRLHRPRGLDRPWGG